jgi:ribonuclease E
VELTRKRQGQNIYELFGRACPSCGGLGHVSVLPGKDLLQPLATATGLVRSAASARAEVALPAETGSGRRRRGGRGRGGAAAAADDAISTNSADSSFAEVDVSDAVATQELPSRRQDPELVAVPMTDQQEEVYGWLGLNPVLLLDEPPESDNLMVRVVRPGADAAAVLEEARQHLAAAGSRRRRRGSRGGSRSNGRGAGANGDAGAADRGSAERDAAPLMVEITPLEITPLDTSPLEPASQMPEPQMPEPVSTMASPATSADAGVDPDQEPRRRRRRSSAATAD